MSNESLDYAVILADLEAKRTALDQSIASLRAAMGQGAGQSGDASSALTNLRPSFGSNGAEVPIPSGAFLGKSIPDAARLYLEIQRGKRTSKEIAEGLRKGGMETTSSNFPQILHSGLDRARKLPGSPLVKLDRSHWGLKGWYPAGIGVSGSNQKAGRKKASRRSKGAKPATQQPQPIQVKGKAHERALEYLGTKPESERSLSDIAAHLEMGLQGARLILGKLKKAGKVRMTAPNMYAIERPQLVAAGD
jgi:hypothetical protein